VVECPHPSDAKLPEWIKQLADEAALKLDPGVVQSLILRVGPDLQLLWREILKLQAYAGEDRRVAVDDVETLVGESRGTTVFVLCDALGERKLGLALQALKRLLQLGEPPVLLLYMIVRHFRILWKAHELAGEGSRAAPGAAAQRLGVPPFAVKRSTDQARNWDDKTLEDAFLRFIRADIELKSGGGAEVLHRLVIDLCAPAKKRKRS
jgi:DNA polymerase-3 subunit delta